MGRELVGLLINAPWGELPRAFHHAFCWFGIRVTPPVDDLRRTISNAPDGSALSNHPSTTSCPWKAVDVTLLTRNSAEAARS